MLRLNKKTCVVTCAGRGIGAAIARAFAREGATVLETDKDADSAADVAREIGGHCRRHTVYGSVAPGYEETAIRTKGWAVQVDVARF